MARHCVGCGAELRDQDRHCYMCGRAVFNEGSPPYVQKSSSRGKVAAALVALLMLGFLLIPVMSAHKATVTVYVHSTPSAYSTEVIGHIDGRQEIYEWNPPGLLSQATKIITFPLWDSQKEVVIKAVANSFDGTLVSTSEAMETIIIENGGNYTVHLYV